jgi:hypothetical protein
LVTARAPMSGVSQHDAAPVPLLDAEDPALFLKLTEAQVELLARHGEVRPTVAFEVLFRQGSERLARSANR